MGSSRAKNTLAWVWGDLAGPPTAHVMFGLGLFPHLCCQGRDLCCGSPDPASSMMDRRVLWAVKLSFGLSTGTQLMLYHSSSFKPRSRGEAGMGWGERAWTATPGSLQPRARFSSPLSPSSPQATCVPSPALSSPCGSTAWLGSGRQRRGQSLQSQTDPVALTCPATGWLCEPRQVTEPL